MSKKGCVIKHSKWIHIGFGEAEGQGLEMESLSSGELSWLEVFFQQQLIVTSAILSVHSKGGGGGKRFVKPK